jgi:RNA recognition motif-containing protein
MEEEGRAVFVGSVSFDTEEKALREVLEDVGTLVSLDFPVHESGKNKGFAIAEFEDAATASRAIEKFNGFELDGRELYVRLDRKKGAPGKGSFRKRGSGRSPTRWRPTDAPPRAPLGTKGDGVSLFVGNVSFPRVLVFHFLVALERDH